MDRNDGLELAAKMALKRADRCRASYADYGEYQTPEGDEMAARFYHAARLFTKFAASLRRAKHTHPSKP